MAAGLVDEVAEGLEFVSDGLGDLGGLYVGGTCGALDGEQGGQFEVVLPDRMLCGCLTNNYAIEYDFGLIGRRLSA